MTPAEVLAFSRYWYGQGVCPGCGSDLTVVAGQGDSHFYPGTVAHVGARKKRVVVPPEGRPSTGGVAVAYSHMFCPYTADQLAALVHIGSGVVKVR